MSLNIAGSRETLLDAMKTSMQVAMRAPEGVAEPAVLLWTDADGQWQPLIPALQSAIPELYVLGKYEPDSRRGPVIWLRCIVDRALPDVSPPKDATPILYLPYVSRQQLRAGGECPRHLQPLIELQYRGAVWHQRNGRDWTVEAFLSSIDTLDLDMASDSRTKKAMMRALPLLATVPIAALYGRRLEAEDFDRLAVGDPIRDLLSWMSDEEEFRGRCDAARWETFQSVCNREYKLDPDKAGRSKAAELLLEGQERWKEVWQRFCESPQLYSGVAELLRETMPPNILYDPAHHPRHNSDQEVQLRKDLKAAAGKPHTQACAQVLSLKMTHGERRQWVWAKLDESPLALILEPLARVAQYAQKPLGGSTIQAIADAYALEGWRCDAAAMEALALTKANSDATLVKNLLAAIYTPWVEKSARHFQEIATQDPGEFKNQAAGIDSEPETCIVFADGLRFDMARKLQNLLESRGCCVRISHRIAPVPTVTATAKPLASPAHTVCEETAQYGDFSPAIGDQHKPSNAQRLRDEIARKGIEVLDTDEITIPLNPQRGGWSETGQLDSLGHKLGDGLAKQIPIQIELITERVLGLLAAGWTKVRVVTDHGWILIPEGLPKVELPNYLTETKWARCAVAQGRVPDGFPVFPWHWNSHVQIVSPPGIGSFFAGKKYAHGGVSPQECVVPDLVVEHGVEAVKAKIEEVQWRGMRCRVTVNTNTPGVKVDLRLHPRDESSSIVVSAKKIEKSDEASLVVENDRHEGAAAIVVLLSSTDQVLDQKPTQVGEE